jgi:hypothetical protein
MLTVSHLPEFLWESAVNHAAYVCNQSYIKAIQNKTPYKGWHNKKLDVQWLKKLSQCLAISKRLTCHKSDKINKTLKIIYVILQHLGFRTSH